MKKIALILGGGVSLGSYVGGAVTELVLALRHNESDTPVTIDVITGSSAGALTGALLARTLVVNRNLLPWIERAWVEAFDAGKLLDAGRRNRSGWFDAAALDQLTSSLIAGPAATDDEPDPSAASPLRLGFTLTNLDGVAYKNRFGYLNASDRTFVTRVYSDAISFQIATNTEAVDPVWEEIRRAAVASASFPFAFPPVRLERKAAEYPGAVFPPGTGPFSEMWFADGGIFDNAPLNLARKLVADGASSDADSDRRYLVVDPTIRSEDYRGAGPANDPTSLAAVAGRLVSAVLGQGAARDWLGAQKVNARLEILLAVLSRMPEMNESLGDPDAVALGRRIGDLAERVAEMRIPAGAVSGDDDDPVIDYLDESLDRIASDPRYDQVLAQVENRAGRSRLAKLIFVLEEAAGLGGKTFLPLYLVSPEGPDDLTGNFMANFGGLFSEQWRANDFRAGRRDARRVLESSLGDIVAYQPDDDSAYDVRELDASFDSIPAAGRQRLESLVGGEVEHLMDEIETGPAAAMFGWVWRPVIRRWLVQRSLAALRDMQ